MLELYSHVKYKDISFNSYNDIELEGTSDITEAYSMMVINDIKYNVQLNVLCDVVCDKLIIFCDNIVTLDYKLDEDMVAYKEDIDCMTLIIKAKTIKSKQLNILLRERKINKLINL